MRTFGVLPAFLLWFATSAVAQEYKVEVTQERPPRRLARDQSRPEPGGIPSR